MTKNPTFNEIEYKPVNINEKTGDNTFFKLMVNENDDGNYNGNDSVNDNDSDTGNVNDKYLIR